MKDKGVIEQVSGEISTLIDVGDDKTTEWTKRVMKWICVLIMFFFLISMLIISFKFMMDYAGLGDGIDSAIELFHSPEPVSDMPEVPEPTGDVPVS